MKQAIFLLLFFSLYSSSLRAQSNDFFYSSWKEKEITISGYEQVDMPTQNHHAEVVVDLTVGSIKVSPNVYGTNSCVWATRFYDQPKLVRHLQDLDPHVIRFPGGSLSDAYFWNTSPNERPDDIPDDINFWAGQNTADWSMSLDDYYKLLDSINSEGSICINYGYARYGLSEKPVEQAAHMAAEWVRFDNGRTRYWELGNENFGSWEIGYEIDTELNQDGQPRIISGALYGRHFRIFADSMKNAAAEIGYKIKLGAVAVESDAPWSNVVMAWNDGVMREAGDVIDYYIIHTYFTPYAEDSPPVTILESPEKVAQMKRYVLDDIEKAGVPLRPIAMTEWNIFAEGSRQQVSNINGLHALLAVGEFIKNGFGQVTRWDIVNGWNDGNDHGMFSYGNEPGVPQWNPRPSFYYMYYMQKMFGDTMIGSEVSGDSEIIAYASTFSSGEIGLAVINRSGADKIVNVKISGYKTAEYMMYILEGGTDNFPFSRKVSVNDQTTTNAGGGPDHYSTIQPFGNEVSGNSIKVKVPGYGAILMAIEKGELVTGAEDGGDSSIIIYPNPGNGNFNVFSPKKKLLNVEVYDMNGKHLWGAKPNVNRYEAKVNLRAGAYLLKLSTSENIEENLILIR